MHSIYYHIIEILLIYNFQVLPIGIHVKKNGGKDGQSCGKLYRPCASIQFAIKNILKSSKDLIFIHGDKANASIFEINEPIVLKHNIHLAKHIDSTVQPIIRYSGSYTQIKYAFVIPKNASISVTIDSIDFVNIGIIYCNMSMECNVTIHNSKSLSNITPSKTRTSQILIHEFFSSFVTISNSSFISTKFAIYAQSNQTSSKYNLSLNYVILEDSKVHIQLKGNDSWCSGIFNQVIVKNSSSISIVSRKIYFTVNNTLFLENKGTYSTNIGTLLELQSSSNCNESFFQMINIQFYNNKYYNKLIHIKSQATKQMAVLQNIFADFNKLHGDESAVLDIKTGKAIIQNVVINNRHKKVDFIFKLSGSSSIRNVSTKEIDAKKIFDLSGNNNNISEIRCSNSKRIDNVFYANLINNTRILNVTFENITTTAVYSLNSLFIFKNVNNMMIERIYINHCNLHKVIDITSLYNISLRNILVENSSIMYLIYIFKGTFLNVSNIKIHKNKIGKAFFFETDYMVVRNVFLLMSSLRRGFHLSKSKSSLITDISFENNTINTIFTSHKLQNTILSNFKITGNTVFSKMNFKCLPIISFAHPQYTSGSCVHLINWSMSKNEMTTSTFFISWSYSTLKPASRQFKISGLRFWKNNVKMYVFEIARKNIFTLHSAYIVNNKYGTCIYIRNSGVEIHNVTIKRNHAHGLVKEIHLVYNHWFDQFLINSKSMNNTHIIVSNLDVSSFETNRAVINDVVLFELMFNVTMVMFNTTLRFFPFQTRGLRIMALIPKYPFLSLNFILQCPPRMHYMQHSERTKTKERMELQTIYSCEMCPKDTYKLYNHQVSLQNETLFTALNRSDSGSLKCKTCPYGSTCTDGQSIGKGNFFGYKTVNSTIMVYVPCPLLYCCSMETKPCTTVNKCNFNRTGTLCGECIKNYQDNVFKSNCIKTSECNRLKFWVFHLLTAGIFLCLHLFIDCAGDVTKLLKNILNRYFKRLLESKNTSPNALPENTIVNHNSQRSYYFQNSPNTLGAMIISTFELKNVKFDDEQQQHHFTISNIVEIIISFYQIRSLINTHMSEYGNAVRVFKVFEDIVNVKMPFVEFSDNFCPYIGLDAVGKAFINNVLLTITMMCFLLIIYLPTRYKYRKSMKSDTSTVPFSCRLEVCYLRLLLFSYKNIVTFCFLTLNCVQFENKYVLYIKGTTECIQSWQAFPLCILVFWVIPFPFVLSYTFKLYRQHHITFQFLLLSVTFPVVGMIILIAFKSCLPTCEQNMSQWNAVKQIFEAPYRLYKDDEIDNYVFWETFRICRSLVISAIVTFAIDPLWKGIVLMPVMLFFLFVYIKVRPLKKNLVVLHWMEMVQSLALCYIVLVNLFKAFLYVFSIPTDGPVESIQLFIAYSELMSSPNIVVVIYFIVIPVYNILGRMITGR